MVLSTPFCNSLTAMVADLWCHLTYNLRGAWHTVYAMLLSNYKWDATWNSCIGKVGFSQIYDPFSNNLILFLHKQWIVRSDSAVWSGFSCSTQHLLRNLYTCLVNNASLSPLENFKLLQPYSKSRTMLFKSYTITCFSIGTLKNNEFSICPKWKIDYF